MLDRIYIPSSGTFKISMIPRTASGNLSVLWYDTEDELTLLTTSTLTWDSAPLTLSADTAIGDRKITVTSNTLNPGDNFCVANGYFTSAESIDGNDIYAYSAITKKLLGTGLSPDSLYPPLPDPESFFQ